MNTEKKLDLIIATIKGDVKAVKELIAQTVPVDAHDTDGNTALTHAARENNKPIARLLLQAGADPNSKNSYGHTPFAFALHHKDRTLFKEMEKAGGDLTVCPYILICAIEGNHSRLITSLIKEPHTLLQRDQDGATPLFVACDLGDSTIVKKLLRAKAPLNDQDKEGNTPLIIAIIRYKLEVIKLLLSAGANPHIANKEGMTALDIAATESKEMVELLLQHCSYTTIEKKRALTHALKTNYKEARKASKLLESVIGQ